MPLPDLCIIIGGAPRFSSLPVRFCRPYENLLARLDEESSASSRASHVRVPLARVPRRGLLALRVAPRRRQGHRSRRRLGRVCSVAGRVRPASHVPGEVPHPGAPARPGADLSVRQLARSGAARDGRRRADRAAEVGAGRRERPLYRRASPRHHCHLHHHLHHRYHHHYQNHYRQHCHHHLHLLRLLLLLYHHLCLLLNQATCHGRRARRCYRR